MSESRRQCAWCGRTLGEDPGLGDPRPDRETGASHGICPACFRVLAELQAAVYREQDDEARARRMEQARPGARPRQPAG
jgi:hypothetical protein